MDDIILKGYIQIKCSNPGRLKRKVGLGCKIGTGLTYSIIKERIRLKVCRFKCAPFATENLLLNSLYLSHTQTLFK